MAIKDKNPPSPEIKARVIGLGKQGLGNEEIADLVLSVNPNQVAGILFRAKVKRAKKYTQTKAAKKKRKPLAKHKTASKQEKPAPAASNVVSLQIKSPTKLCMIIDYITIRPTKLSRMNSISSNINNSDSLIIIGSSCLKENVLCKADHFVLVNRLCLSVECFHCFVVDTNHFSYIYHFLSAD